LLVSTHETIHDFDHLLKKPLITGSVIVCLGSWIYHSLHFFILQS